MTLLAATPTTGSKKNSLWILRFGSVAAGGKLLGSSEGPQTLEFRSRRGCSSPYASVIRLDRWQALSADERRGFAPQALGHAA